jgi:large subunit ribosomal protein L22
MIIKAEQKNTRQTSRKVRLVADVIRKMSLTDAVNHLAVVQRKSSVLLLKVLRQAIANATNNYGLSIADLEIDKILVNDGPALKRWRAVSRGRAHTILKRTCHVRIDLRTKKDVKPVVSATKAAPVTVAAAAEKEVAKEEVGVKETAKKSQAAIKLDRSKSQAVKVKTTTKGQAGKLIQSQKKGSK